MLSPIGLISYLQGAIESDTFEIFERLSRLCLAKRYSSLLMPTLEIKKATKMVAKLYAMYIANG